MTLPSRLWLEITQADFIRIASISEALAGICRSKPSMESMEIIESMGMAFIEIFILYE